ncbi:MAG: cytochrome c3 family protein, partial [Verrucomicrobiota bacterium]
TNKLGCSDCHNPMARFSANGLMKKAGITETCQTCHQQQRAGWIDGEIARPNTRRRYMLNQRQLARLLVDGISRQAVVPPV